MPETTPDAPRDLARITLSVLGIGVLIAASLWVLSPFLSSLLWAVMIVVSTWPLMLGVQRRLGGRRGAAVAVMTVVLLLVLFVPLYVAISTIVEQSERISDMLHSAQTLQVPPPPAWLESIPLVGRRAAARWLALSELPHDQIADRLVPYATTALAWFAAKVGGFGTTIVHFLLTVVIAAILYAKGEGAAAEVRRFFRRLSGDRGERIVTLSGQAIRAVALGIVVTALVQTVLAAIGLFAVGVPFAGVIAAVVLVLCIAQLGPLLALLPCVIWLYAQGAAGRGTVLLVVMLLAQTLDNVLRPVLIKRGADLSLLLILPGVIGGLVVLGIIGLFVGPVILAVTSTLLQGWVDAGVGEHAPAGALPAPSAGEKGAPPGGGAVSRTA